MACLHPMHIHSLKETQSVEVVAGLSQPCLYWIQSHWDPRLMPSKRRLPVIPPDWFREPWPQTGWKWPMWLVEWRPRLPVYFKDLFLSQKYEHTTQQVFWSESYSIIWEKTVYTGKNILMIPAKAGIKKVRLSKVTTHRGTSTWVLLSLATCREVQLLHIQWLAPAQVKHL